MLSCTQSSNQSNYIWQAVFIIILITMVINSITMVNRNVDQMACHSIVFWEVQVQTNLFWITTTWELNRRGERMRSQVTWVHIKTVARYNESICHPPCADVPGSLLIQMHIEKNKTFIFARNMIAGWWWRLMIWCRMHFVPTIGPLHDPSQNAYRVLYLLVITNLTKSHFVLHWHRTKANRLEHGIILTFIFWDIRVKSHIYIKWNFPHFNKKRSNIFYR